MKLALGVSLLSGASLVVLYGIMVGVMVPKWQASVQQLWDVTAIQTTDAMLEVVNSTLSFIQFGARSVVNVANDGINTTGGFDPAPLIQTFATFNEASTHRFSSMGFMMHATPAPSRLPNAKASWQAAVDWRCPVYMYAFSDNAINPQFLGYCGTASGVVNLTASPAYMGSDWGLKPQETSILAGTLDATFLPIFDLFGAFTLTYETGYGANPPSGLTFAELDLTLFSNHITTRVSLLNGKGLAYIYESSSGAMIASTLNGTIFDGNHTRYTITTVPSQAIQDTADGQDAAWLINMTHRIESGLNWTIIVCVRDSDIKGNINDGIVIASCASLVVLLVLVLFTWIGMHCCVVRQLRAKKEGTVSIPYTMFDEIK